MSEGTRIEPPEEMARRLYVVTLPSNPRSAAEHGIRERDAQVAEVLKACFVPGDDTETAENVRHVLAALRGAS